MRKIIGDLSNTERVLIGLDLLPLIIGEHHAKKEMPVQSGAPGPSGAGQTRKKNNTSCGCTWPARRRSSVHAIANVKKICEEHLKGRYELEVIDLYQQPQLAQGEQIIAAPTLIKKLPLPLRRIIGDMSKTERVLVGLDLQENHDRLWRLTGWIPGFHRPCRIAE